MPRIDRRRSGGAVSTARVLGTKLPQITRAVPRTGRTAAATISRDLQHTRPGLHLPTQIDGLQKIDDVGDVCIPNAHLVLAVEMRRLSGATPHRSRCVKPAERRFPVRSWFGLFEDVLSERLFERLCSEELLSCSIVAEMPRAETYMTIPAVPRHPPCGVRPHRFALQIPATREWPRRPRGRRSGRSDRVDVRRRYWCGRRWPHQFSAARTRRVECSVYRSAGGDYAAPGTVLESRCFRKAGIDGSIHSFGSSARRAESERLHLAAHKAIRRFNDSRMSDSRSVITD